MTLIMRGRLLPVFVAAIVAHAKTADAGTKQTFSDLARCGGRSLSTYIGKPVAEIRSLNLTNTRFVCQEYCLATADVQATRLTVFYSKKTSRVTDMHCG